VKAGAPVKGDWPAITEKTRRSWLRYGRSAEFEESTLVKYGLAPLRSSKPREQVAPLRVAPPISADAFNTAVTGVVLPTAGKALSSVKTMSKEKRIRCGMSGFVGSSKIGAAWVGTGPPVNAGEGRTLMPERLAKPPLGVGTEIPLALYELMLKPSRTR
jgi:hypothetical protein